MMKITDNTITLKLNKEDMQLASKWRIAAKCILLYLKVQLKNRKLSS